MIVLVGKFEIVTCALVWGDIIEYNSKDESKRVLSDSVCNST